MKKTINFLFAALALMAAASSCSKNIQPEQTADRIITCTFSANEDGTKTTVDGLSPRWAVGDQIKLFGYKKISEDTYTEQGTTIVSLAAGDIQSGGKKCSFAIPGEWNLSSEDFVYAVYPASAALSITDGGWWSIDKVNFTVPAITDGTFASANICVGRLAMYNTCLEFLNVTPVLKISVPAGAFKKLEIYSGNDWMPINGEVFVNNLYGTLGAGWASSTKSATTTVNISSTATEIYVPVMCFNVLGIGSTFTFTLADDTTKVITLASNNTMHLGYLFNLGTITPD